jgi:hypothetical protein
MIDSRSWSHGIFRAFSFSFPHFDVGRNLSKYPRCLRQSYFHTFPFPSSGWVAPQGLRRGILCCCRQNPLAQRWICLLRGMIPFLRDILNCLSISFQSISTHFRWICFILETLHSPTTFTLQLFLLINGLSGLLATEDVTTRTTSPSFMVPILQPSLFSQSRISKQFFRTPAAR